jgi:3,4-dihydroxy 2-butanone 4-phosphate synthase/GTP cyclohydrolase II
MTTHQPGPDFAPIELAVADIAAGRPVVVVDDEDRENEGDLIFAAQSATADLVTFMIRECGGLICVPMTGPDLDRLALDQMVSQNADRMGTAFTVSVDARAGLASRLIVFARSAAEIPVVTPARASTDTVNAVPIRSAFWLTI